MVAKSYQGKLLYKGGVKMIINVLQHTPNERPGSIQEWAHMHHHDFFVYHPYKFQILPIAAQTDLLVLLGGPMSPNDKCPWIVQERQLIKTLLQKQVPILGICFGAQQIVKTLGYSIHKAPFKEVGWGPVNLQSKRIPGLPDHLTVLHWHEEMFELPKKAELLFSNDNLTNQGFVLGHQAVGLQFHLEPKADNVKEIVVNDAQYLAGSVFQQSAQEILQMPIPKNNEAAMFRILDYLTSD